MNRPSISSIPLHRSQNSQAPKNLAAGSSAPEKDFETIENDNSHSSDHPNDLAREEEDQGSNPDDTLDNP